MKNYIDFDLNYLLSFKKPITARLAEYFKPLFYGSKKYHRISRIFNYSELCKYLLIKEHTSKSLILPRNGSRVSLSATLFQDKITFRSAGVALSVGIFGGWAKQ